MADTPTGPVITTLVGQPVNGGTIEVAGTGIAGDTITLYGDDGTTTVGTGTVGADGSFDITTTASFADGNHTLTATQTDADGVTSAFSTGFAVAVNPAAPSISAVTALPLNVAEFELTGTGQAGDTVALYADGGSDAVGTGVVAADGSFDITTPSTFSPGPHVFTATESDAAGLSSTPSMAASVTLYVTAYGYIWGYRPNNIVVHVGDTFSLPLTVENWAPATGYSESILVTVAQTTGGATTTVPTAEIAPSSSATVTIGLDTSVAGNVGGSVTYRFQSDGAGVDNSGLSDIGTFTASLSGAVDNYAQASVEKIAGAGTLTGSAATGYTLDFGTVALGSGSLTASLDVLNSATGLADLLSGYLALPVSSDFGNSGNQYFFGLGAGQTADPATVTLSTSTAGTFSETITVHASGSNASGYYGALADETLTVTGTVVPEIPPAPGIDLVTSDPFDSFRALVHGTGVPGDEVTLYADGTATAVGFGSVDSSGRFIIETASLAAGSHMLTATQTDYASDLTSAASVSASIVTGDMLTSGHDNISGGGGNLTILAMAGTLSAKDVIDPTAGDNTLDLQGSGTFNLKRPTTLANISTINAQDIGWPGPQIVRLRDGLDLTLNVASSTDAGAGIKIIGALNNDTIHLGTGADSVKLAGGNNLVTVGSAAQSVTTGTGDVTVQASADDAGVLVKGGTGHDVLEITTGGTATLNAKTSRVMVQLDQATTLVMNKAKTVTVIGSTGADTITAGGSGQILTGNGGGDTLIGAAAGHDTFKDTLADFAGATIGGFKAKTDKIDVSDFAASAISFGFSENAAGTIGTLSMTAGGQTASVQLLGQYMASGFVTASDGGAGTAITYNPSAHGTMLAAAH